MSSGWMRKLHGLVPLTEQEEQVQEILEQYAIPYKTHQVFPVDQRLYVTDFFLPVQNVVIECWKSISRRGVALPWVEKNACYVEWKFRRIKGVEPGARCVALVEVERVEPDMIRKYVGAVMEHADILCCSMEEFAEAVREWCGVE